MTPYPHVPERPMDLEPPDEPEITDADVQEAMSRLVLNHDGDLILARATKPNVRIGDSEAVLGQLAFAITGEQALDHSEEWRERIRQLLAEEQA